MSGNTNDEVAALMRQLLFHLGESMNLCDRITVHSLRKSEAPLPPILSQFSTQAERMDAARNWVSEAQTFSEGNEAGILLAHKIVHCQDMVRSLATEMHGELKKLAV